MTFDFEESESVFILKNGRMKAQLNLNTTASQIWPVQCSNNFEGTSNYFLETILTIAIRQHEKFSYTKLK